MEKIQLISNELSRYVAELSEGFAVEVNNHKSVIMSHSRHLKGKHKQKHQTAIAMHQAAIEAFKKIPEGKGVRAAKKKAKQLRKEALLYTRNIPDKEWQ